MFPLNTLYYEYYYTNELFNTVLKMRYVTLEKWKQNQFFEASYEKGGKMRNEKHSEYEQAKHSKFRSDPRLKQNRKFKRVV